MLEIIVVWGLVKYIGRLAYDKGFKPLGFQLMTVFLWIAGEFSAGILIALIRGDKFSIYPDYLLALLGAIIGAGISILIVKLLPDLSFNVSSMNWFQSQIKWLVPLVVSLAVVYCLLIGIAGAVSYKVFSNALSAAVLAPEVGTHLDADGHIVRELQGISSKVDTIYLQFTFLYPKDQEALLLYRWYADGEQIYQHSEMHHKGTIITRLDRTTIGYPEFPEGNISVEIWLKDKKLATKEFVIRYTGIQSNQPGLVLAD